MKGILSAVLVALAATAHAQGVTPAELHRARAFAPMCDGCHGIPDYRTAYPQVYSVPRIAGQNPAYIVEALKEYKSGARNHPSMDAVARGLSDQDMAALAAYYGDHAK